MKLGRIILAAIFFLIFAASAFVAVDAMRSVSYEDVFPDDINAVIWVHQPLDVPLKALNSTVARKFFKTNTGKKLLTKLDDALAAMKTARKEKKAGPKPVIFKKKIEGITVYYTQKPKEAEEEETPAEEKKAEPVHGEKGMGKKKLEQALGIGGAVVKDLYIGLYGSPMEALMGGPKRFMFAMDLGRMSILPRFALPRMAKTLPPDAKFYEPDSETGEMPVWVSFAFVHNMVIAGDPEGVERMVHAIKGSPMKLVKKDPMSGEETTETINPKPLKNSKVWGKLKQSLNRNANFNFVLLLPNLLADPMIKDSISDNAEKFGLLRILGLVYSNQLDADGVKFKTEFIFDPPNPIFSLLKQQEREMKWPDLLSDNYHVGAGLTVDNYPALWKTAKALFGEPIQESEKGFNNYFGETDMENFLGLLGHEASVINFKDGTVCCSQMGPGARDYFAKLERQNAEEAIASAEKDIAAAREGGAEAFSSEALERAAEALDDARNAHAESQLVEAVQLARKASEFAHGGLYSLYNLADKLTDSVSFNASEQNEAAKAEFYKAKDAYEKGEWASGTESSRKAVELGKVAYVIGKAGDAIDEARFAGAGEKAAGTVATAENSFGAAKQSFKAGNMDAATQQAIASIAQANKAKAAATGEEPPETTVSMPEIKPMDYTLPDVQSPRVVNGVEVYTSVGTEPTSYTFLSDGQMCFASAEELDKYLETPRGKAAKSNDMRTLMEAMQRETQALVLVNIRELLDEQGLLSEELSDPEDEDEKTRMDVATTLKGQNLLLGVYMVSDDDSITLTTVSPIKLFDGGTAGGARSAAAILLWAAKWLFYLLGLICLYLTFRMAAGKSKKA